MVLYRNLVNRQDFTFMRFLKVDHLLVIFSIFASTVVQNAESREGEQFAGEIVGGYAALFPTYKLGTFTLKRLHTEPTITIFATSMTTALVLSTAGHLAGKHIFEDYETKLSAALIGGGSSVIIGGLGGYFRFPTRHGFAGGSAVGMWLAPLGSTIGNYIWYKWIRSDKESRFGNGSTPAAPIVITFRF